MLELAFKDNRIRYVRAPAEALPFSDGAFDLLTLGRGLHWLDNAAFFAEAARLLAHGGQTAIYDHGIAGEMACRPNFGRWHREDYLSPFPPPARAPDVIAAATPGCEGFTRVFQTAFDHHWPFSADQVAAYLLSQSNVITAITSARTTVESACARIINGTAHCFHLEREYFRYSGSTRTPKWTDAEMEGRGLQAVEACDDSHALFQPQPFAA